MGNLEPSSKLIEGSDPLPGQEQLNLNNTEIAFSHLSDKDLKKTAWIFKMMNNPRLVSIMSFIGLWAVKLRFPFSDFAVKKTIFPIFCGGENLLDCQSSIEHLYKNDALTILDYGAEGKSAEEDLDRVKDENVRAVEMAASNESVPGIAIKFTGLVDNEILEKLHANKALNDGEKSNYTKFLDRVHAICGKAAELGVGVFIDAEESWIQRPIDELTLQLMQLYNTEKVIIYNTYQLYRHDKLAQLKADFKKINEQNLFFGAKLVRGAYMEKENDRALEMGYPTPIQPNKASTDRDFDLACQYCLNHHAKLGFVCASHNIQSNVSLANSVKEKGLDATHPHINFSQLLGMSDYITFNLASAGFNVAKYVPYGPVKEVIPYLIRRAQENTSVTGEMGRELSLIDKEMRRRGLKK